MQSSSSNNRKPASQQSFHSSASRHQQGSTASQASQPPSRLGTTGSRHQPSHPPLTPTSHHINTDLATSKCILSNVRQRTRSLTPPPQVRTRPNPFTDKRPDCARSDPRSKVARLAPTH
ncbi:hypothetical protein J6590_053411 [Homalodisca vitripennis]|nr:hypothetical protein J6590_053411 [Homalodisca vitripennis]